MEHVHARLAMDAGYRLQYVEGLRRTKEERAVTKGAAEAASATAEPSGAAAATSAATKERVLFHDDEWGAVDVTDVPPGMAICRLDEVTGV